MTADLLLTGIGELATNRPRSPDLVGVIHDAVVAVRAGRVAWAGPAADLPAGLGELPRLDAGGRAVVPGFVDAHTHLVFAGDRSGEFCRRLRGEAYEEILASGGGIHSTVAATRAASLEDLAVSACERAWRLLRQGTTTVEIKSGYGLDTETEVKILEAAREVGERVPLDVVPTFLGAHVVAQGRGREEYLSLVTGEMLAACAPLARYCDVFCDRGAFSVDEARRVLRAGRERGLRSRLHAEQLDRTGGAWLAAEVGAASADHLDHATPEDAAALRQAAVVAVLLPAASFSLRAPQAPGRMLWDAGVTVALATDCNPGTSYVESMPFVIALACLEMGLTPEEALWAATRGGALALDEPDKGWVVEGAVADLAILDAPSYRHLPYRPGGDLVWAVVKDGAVVVG
jgi:imidazolonepropionase